MDIRFPNIRIPRIKIKLETEQETKQRKLASLKKRQAALHKKISNLQDEIHQP